MALDGKQIKPATVSNSRLETASNIASADAVVLSNADAKIDISFLPTEDLVSLPSWQPAVVGTGTFTLQTGRINKYSRTGVGAMTLQFPSTPNDGDIVELKEIGASPNTVVLTTAAGTVNIEGVSSSGDATSVTLNVAKLYLSYKWDAVNSTWRLIAWVNHSAGGGGTGSTPVQDQLSTLATTADGSPVSAVGLSVEPSPVAIILVYLNGVGINHISYGDKSGSLYLSNDGGTTSVLRSAVTVGTQLYWNGSVAGFQLEPGWTVKVVYSV